MDQIPSRSALRVALRRAAHQLYDARPLVFEDPLAVRILGAHASELARTPGSGAGRRPPLRARTHSFALRAFLVARSRYTEDLLAQAVAGGVTQYVLLGAGLDTFAHRNPYAQLRVFELDHPATQAWKRTLVEQAKLAQPASLTYVPLDLESVSDAPAGNERLTAALLRAGLDPALPVFFACLGVVPYLTLEAFQGILRAVAGFPSGSKLVFDYALPRQVLSGVEQRARDSIAERVRAMGEPFQLFFTPAEVAAELRDYGISVDEDLDGTALNQRYFDHRPDTLRVLPSSAHLLAART